MSQHKIPLTNLEREGLDLHRLPIGVPSILSDSFRNGVRWALENSNEAKLLKAEISKRIEHNKKQFDEVKEQGQ